MNWLSHAFLSTPNIEFRLGNLLADVVKRRDRANLPPAFLDGIRQHQLIDAFADTHPAFRRSRARIRGDFPHATGILIDIFYDHFLALDWNRYAPEPLDAFTTRLYADIRQHPIPLPEPAQTVLDRILAEDWLGSYRRLDGIEASLRRISQRLQMRTGRNLALERGVPQLLAHFEDLRSDFTELFPDLQAHVAEVPVP